MSIAADRYPCRASTASSQARRVACETVICLATNARHCRRHKGSQCASGGLFPTGRAARLHRLFLIMNACGHDLLVEHAMVTFVFIGYAPWPFITSFPFIRLPYFACASPQFIPIPIFASTSSANPFCWHRPIAPPANFISPLGCPHL